MSDNYTIPKDYLGGERKDIIDDDIRYMSIALAASTKSEDPSTQVGACYVNKEGILMSVGFNTALWTKDKFPYRGDIANIGIENTKYPYIIHAEIMGVYNYRGKINDFEDSTLYVTLAPCENCTRFVAGLGVKKIVYLNERKYGTINTPKVIMDNCNIKYINLKEKTDIEKIEFDFMQNEKNNIKILKLKK